MTKLNSISIHGNLQDPENWPVVIAGENGQEIVTDVGNFEDYVCRLWAAIPSLDVEAFTKGISNKIRAIRHKIGEEIGQRRDN